MYKASQSTKNRGIKISLLTLSLYSFLLIFSTNCIAQEHFVGKLTYRVTAVDSNVHELVPADTFQLYTNDTIVRIESRTGLGQQVSIRHLELHKSYILIYFRGEKLAIKTDVDSVSSVIDNKQQIEYLRWKKRKFGPYKAKRAKVTREDLGETRDIYYLPGLRPDLLNVYDGIKGLPAVYYLQHQEGVFKYELIEIDPTLPERDRFGVPSDFQKITFDEFMERLKPSSN